MADLFSVTAPLTIRLPSGERHIVVERFRHPQGLLYFTPFWHAGRPEEAVRLVEGEIKGEGPWKVGGSVVHVLGCHGTDAELATLFDSWRDYPLQAGDEYPSRAMILSIARARGATVAE
jgi:hypothetical protein